jgi:putative ABC transport system substrate-binding protein
MRRLSLAVVLVVGFALAPGAASAQPSGRIARVGVLNPQRSTEPPTVQREPFEQGLRALGWIMGGNLVIEYRYADGDPEQLSQRAAELVGLKVDVIVARGPQAIRAAQRATSTIPIVMSAGADPVRAGFVASLARPGGNITGLALFSDDIGTKQLSLLKEALPGLSRVAILMNPVMSADQDEPFLKSIHQAARVSRIETQIFTVTKPEAIPATFAAIKRGRVDGVLVRADPNVLEPNLTNVVAQALKLRLPAMYPWRFYVEAGGLMSYATSVPDIHRRSATYVSRILRGENPSALPVELPTKFELAINLKTAKVLGLTIPQSILLRADQVIE